jgi:hypothetical protein
VGPDPLTTSTGLALLRSYGETFNAMGKLTSRRLVELGAALAHPCLPTSPLWAALLPMPLSCFLPHAHARERAASVRAQGRSARCSYGEGDASSEVCRVARRVPNARKLARA